MDFDTFCRLTPAEFGAIVESWNKEKEREEKAEWERMRLLACISIQPHISKKITPRQLVPLPWDEEKKPEEHENKRMTPEQQRERMRYLMELHKNADKERQRRQAMA